MNSAKSPDDRLASARWLVGSALVLGLAFEIFFYGHPPGISVPLWVGLCILALGLAAWRHSVRGSLTGWLWGIPVLALSLVIPWRLEPLTLFLAVVLGLMALALLVDQFVPGDLMRFGWIDLLRGILVTPLLMLARPWPALSEAWRGSVGEPQGWRRPLLAGLRGLILALPILAVFTALLAAADVVFSDYVQEALAWLDLDKVVEIVSRALVIGLVSLACLGAVVLALGSVGRRRLAGEDKPLVKRFLGYAEAVIVLFSLDLLFAAFVAIQFAYLFGGESNITASGYTYAEYARRGFGELVFAAALSLGLIYLLAQVTHRESRARVRGFNLLAAAQVILLGVVLASAFKRLVLYEQAYGFTRLRTYTHVAIAWIAVALAVYLALLLIDRLRVFAPAALIGAVGFAMSLAILNVDAFIVRSNAARMAQTGDLDAYYLASLSDDAVPGLVEVAQVMGSEEQQVLMAELSCRRQRLEAWEDLTDWRSLHLSRLKAVTALETIAPALEAYPVQIKVEPGWVSGASIVMIGEEEYWCGYGGWD